MTLEVLADNKRFDNALDLDFLLLEKRILKKLSIVYSAVHVAPNRCVDCGVISKGKRCFTHARMYQRMKGTKV